MNRRSFLATAAASALAPASILAKQADAPTMRTVSAAEAQALVDKLVDRPEIEEGQIKVDYRERDGVESVNLNPPTIGEGDEAVMDVPEYARQLKEMKGKVRIQITVVGRFGGVLKHKAFFSEFVPYAQREESTQMLMGWITKDWLKQRTAHTPAHEQSP
jgi:hypothetical protein